MTLRGRLALAALSGAALGAYVLTVRGALTLDLKLGRRERTLGPLVWQIGAPRDQVFEILARPYLGRTPRALASKLQVLERSEDMVLAEHYTQVGPLVTTTLETVRFEPPERVHFRLVRGPVPFAVEQFELREWNGGTTLEYRGTLGADLWALGKLWMTGVAYRWEAAVRESLDAVKVEAERTSTRAARSTSD